MGVTHGMDLLDVIVSLGRQRGGLALGDSRVG
jgi:hypothetical protein